MLLYVDPEKHFPQTIYLCHTRELTIQIFSFFQKMNSYTKFTGAVCLVDEENPKEPNNEAQLLFGTPTTFVHWIKNEKLDISQVNFVVIDEADAILLLHISKI